eukprot:CAMPEP_0119397576 /NCGR_PEP_ID=MMETSP1334-20130426/140404_1 /TAXON_ID=127549 /ORGANISM="Calcidiscus leptoporus, Strain RCC1130" /LENGTH=140 /DNA_ID=CAMNT_0007421421 /DNA_START=1154 /DNA_END=1574 /DNA_ORIENTATION=+
MPWPCMYLASASALAWISVRAASAALQTAALKESNATVAKSLTHACTPNLRNLALIESGALAPSPSHPRPRAIGVEGAGRAIGSSAATERRALTKSKPNGSGECCRPSTPKTAKWRVLPTIDPKDGAPQLFDRADLDRLT